MKVFRVVADSSCLIGLAQINLFKLLKELFSEVYIPDVVYDEIVIKGKGEAGSEETESAVKDGWILKKSVNDKKRRFYFFLSCLNASESNVLNFSFSSSFFRF